MAFNQVLQRPSQRCPVPLNADPLYSRGKLPAHRAVKKNRRRKPGHTKQSFETVWQDDSRTLVFGELQRKQGRPPKTARLFAALGEKLPRAALSDVRRHVRSEGLEADGVYVAHDSMGAARYIGRGAIFTRLAAHFRRYPDELIYFSFYIVEQKVHEREIETLLIRANAGPQLEFNDRKKRVGIKPGSVRDYEAGTLFYERQGKRGRKRKA